MNLIKLGCDPEIFLKQGNNFISSIGLIGGTKDAPMPIGEGCAVQEDNVAVEFNTPPAPDVESFLKSVNFNLDYLKKRAVALNMELAIEASAIFSDNELSHPSAMEFGCEPDYNTWTKRRNPRPRAANRNLRSAGGHVHFGSKEIGLDPWQVGRAADLFLGVPSVEMDPDTQRRELYGKAGAVRIKPYGVEYRTLSNFWLKSEDLMKWVWEQSQRAVEFVRSGNELSDEMGLRIQQCINESDAIMARQLKVQYGI